MLSWRFWYRLDYIDYNIATKLIRHLRKWKRKYHIIHLLFPLKTKSKWPSIWSAYRAKTVRISLTNSWCTIVLAALLCSKIRLYNIMSGRYPYVFGIFHLHCRAFCRRRNRISNVATLGMLLFRFRESIRLLSAWSSSRISIWWWLLSSLVHLLSFTFLIRKQPKEENQKIKKRKLIYLRGTPKILPCNNDSDTSVFIPHSLW